MTTLVSIFKPVLFSFLASKAVKDLVVELLEKYVKTTDNQIDDAVVSIVRERIYKAQ